MPGNRTDPAGPGWKRWLPALLLLTLVVSVLGALHQGSRQQLHEVRVDVVAPLVMSQQLVNHLNHKYDGAVIAAATDSRREGLDDLRRGRVLAVLIVDLAGATDELVLSQTNRPGLNQAVRTHVAVVEKSYGRTATTRTLSAPTSPGHLGAAVLLAILFGLLAVLVISILYGPVAYSFRLGARRFWVIGALSLVFAAIVQFTVLGDLTRLRPAQIVFLSLVCLAAGLFTTAVAQVFGWSGEAVAATALFVMAVPEITNVDSHLQAWPFNSLHQWGIPGAGSAGLAALGYDRDGLLRPVVVLAGWVVVAVLTNTVARAFRTSTGAAAVEERSSPRVWRRRTVLAVLPVALVMGLATRFFTVEPSPTPKPDASRASTSNCLPVGKVTSIEDLNRLTDLRGSPAFEGADVGADVLLSDGRRLWLFGDTLRDPSFAGQRFVRNSMLIAGHQCLDVVIPPGKGAVIPDRDNQVGYWPMSVGSVARPGYDLVAVGAQRVRSTGSSAFSFENLGPSVAVFTVPHDGTPQLLTVRDLGPDSTDPRRPTWGAAAAVDGSWVYTYGTARSSKDALGFSLRVARARVDDIIDQTKWTYWDGKSWVRSASSAAELIPAQGGVSQTLSVFESGPTWYALSKRDEFLGTDLTIWSAPSPTGPFTAGDPVAKIPSNTAAGKLVYMPLAHPTLLPEAGTVVASYSQNVTDPSAAIEDPRNYRIRFLRVPLPR